MSGPHTEKYDIPEQDHNRLNKLSDVIGDYLESETNAVSAYEDIITELDTWIKYHQEQLEKSKRLRDLLMGGRSAERINNLEEPI